MDDYYAKILTDDARLRVFERAIAKAVRPDDVVLDLGCGIGTYAFYAARAGACRVHAVDLHPIAMLGRSLARDNGLQVEFTHGDALGLELPEPVTLVICEEFLATLLEGPARELLDDARARLLAEGARIIPARGRLWAAPLSSADARGKILPAQLLGPRDDGLDLGPLVEMRLNDLHQIHEEADALLLAPPVVVLDHDFAESIPTRWECDQTVELNASGSLDGLCMWMELQLDDENSYSNAPGDAAIWGQLLFLVPERWEAGAGECLRFRVQFQAHGMDGFWKWNLELGGPDAKPRLKHTGNTFASTPMSASMLENYKPDRPIRLTRRAEEEALVLSLVDGQRTADDIAAEFMRRMNVTDHDEALRRVFQHLEDRRRS
ncbi:MAG: class I SAM-dependent methyltransferase [bacterium]|nr:class I SAM-dependent methyltransferase [bacterium]